MSILLNSLNPYLNSNALWVRGQGTRRQRCCGDSAKSPSSRPPPRDKEERAGPPLNYNEDTYKRYTLQCECSMCTCIYKYYSSKLCSNSVFLLIESIRMQSLRLVSAIYAIASYTYILHNAHGLCNLFFTRKSLLRAVIVKVRITKICICYLVHKYILGMMR